MTMPTLQKTRNARYHLRYQLAWCVSWRRELLQPPIDRSLKTILRRIGRAHGYRILGLQVFADHLYFTIEAPPRLAPAELAKHLKGVSARHLLKAHPELREKLDDGQLWTSTYFAATVGPNTVDGVQAYVQRHRKKGRKRKPRVKN
jgi:putative transposase